MGSEILGLIPSLHQIRFRFRRDIRSQSDVQNTAEINCTRRKQNRILHLSMVAFKETIRRNPFRGEHIDHERKYLKYKMLIY